MGVISLGDMLKVVKAGFSLLHTNISRRRESVIMILCLVWRIEHVCLLYIAAICESRCLNR